jgi:hypothetical protein
LPSKQLARIGNIAISPDAFEDWPYSLQQMLGWAFEPADEAQLVMLIECGRRDALAWAQQSGLAELAAGSMLLRGSRFDSSASNVESVQVSSALDKQGSIDNSFGVTQVLQQQQQ